MIYEDLRVDDQVQWITITQCAWCNGIKIGSRYFRVPGLGKLTFLRLFRLPFLPTFAVTTSHGLCEDCAGNMWGELASDRKRARGA